MSAQLLPPRRAPVPAPDCRKGTERLPERVIHKHHTITAHKHHTMLLLAICTLSLASAASAAAQHSSPTFYRKQRMLRAISSGQAISMRLRGGGGGGAAPSTAALLNRKERILRAVSSGQAVTEDALLSIEAVATTRSQQAPHAQGHNGASPALLRQAATSSRRFAATLAADTRRHASPARVCHRKRRLLHAVSTGHSITHALERGYVHDC